MTFDKRYIQKCNEFLGLAKEKLDGLKFKKARELLLAMEEFNSRDSILSYPQLHLKILNLLASSERHLRMIESAMSRLKRGVDICYSFNCEPGETLITMSAVYMDMNDYIQAKKCSEEALVQFEAANNVQKNFNNSRLIATCHYNIGQCYMELKKPGKAANSFNCGIIALKKLVVEPKDFLLKLLNKSYLQAVEEARFTEEEYKFSEDKEQKPFNLKAYQLKKTYEKSKGSQEKEKITQPSIGQSSFTTNYVKPTKSAYVINHRKHLSSNFDKGSYLGGKDNKVDLAKYMPIRARTNKGWKDHNTLNEGSSSAKIEEENLADSWRESAEAELTIKSSEKQLDFRKSTNTNLIGDLKFSKKEKLPYVTLEGTKSPSGVRVTSKRISQSSVSHGVEENTRARLSKNVGRLSSQRQSKSIDDHYQNSNPKRNIITPKERESSQVDESLHKTESDSTDRFYIKGNESICETEKNSINKKDVFKKVSQFKEEMKESERFSKRGPVPLLRLEARITESSASKVTSKPELELKSSPKLAQIAQREANTVKKPAEHPQWKRGVFKQRTKHCSDLEDLKKELLGENYNVFSRNIASPVMKTESMISTGFTKEKPAEVKGPIETKIPVAKMSEDKQSEVLGLVKQTESEEPLQNSSKTNLEPGLAAVKPEIDSDSLKNNQASEISSSKTKKHQFPKITISISPPPKKDSSRSSTNRPVNSRVENKEIEQPEGRKLDQQQTEDHVPRDRPEISDAKTITDNTQSAVGNELIHAGVLSPETPAKDSLNAVKIESDNQGFDQVGDDANNVIPVQPLQTGETLKAINENIESANQEPTPEAQPHPEETSQASEIKPSRDAISQSGIISEEEENTQIHQVLDLNAIVQEEITEIERLALQECLFEEIVRQEVEHCSEIATEVLDMQLAEEAILNVLMSQFSFGGENSGTEQTIQKENKMTGLISRFPQANLAEVKEEDSKQNKGSSVSSKEEENSVKSEIKLAIPPFRPPFGASIKEDDPVQERHFVEAQEMIGMIDYGQQIIPSKPRVTIDLGLKAVESNTQTRRNSLFKRSLSGVDSPDQKKALQSLGKPMPKMNISKRGGIGGTGLSPTKSAFHPGSMNLDEYTGGLSVELKRTEGKHIQNAKVLLYLCHFNIDTKKPTLEQIEAAETFFGMHHPLIVATEILEGMSTEVKRNIKMKNYKSLVYLLKHSAWKNFFLNTEFQALQTDLLNIKSLNTELRKKVEEMQARDKSSRPDLELKPILTRTLSKQEGVPQSFRALDSPTNSSNQVLNLPIPVNILAEVKKLIEAVSYNSKGPGERSKMDQDRRGKVGDSELMRKLKRLKIKCETALSMATKQIHSAILEYYNHELNELSDEDKNSDKKHHYERMIKKYAGNEDENSVETEAKDLKPKTHQSRKSLLDTRLVNNKDIVDTIEESLNQRNTDLKYFKDNKRYLLKTLERPLEEVPVINEFSVFNSSRSEGGFFIKIRFLSLKAQEFYAAEVWTTEGLFVKGNLISAKLLEKEIIEDSTKMEKAKIVSAFLVRSIRYNTEEKLHKRSGVPEFDWEKAIKTNKGKFRNPLISTLF